MDPEIETLAIDSTYDVHGVPVRFDPGPASDVLVCFHQPPGDQRAMAVAEFTGGGFSVAESYLTVLVRASSFVSPDPAPMEGGQVTFQSGRLAGAVFRIGQAPKDHDAAGYEQRLSLQKVS